jgi:hypothetical protein
MMVGDDVVPSHEGDLETVVVHPVQASGRISVRLPVFPLMNIVFHLVPCPETLLALVLSEVDGAQRICILCVSDLAIHEVIVGLRPCLHHGGMHASLIDFHLLVMPSLSELHAPLSLSVEVLLRDGVELVPLTELGARLNLGNLAVAGGEGIVVL